MQELGLHVDNRTATARHRQPAGRSEGHRPAGGRYCRDSCEQRDFALAVLGSGEPGIERFFESLQRKAEGRVSFYRGYNNKLAHWIEAGSATCS